MENIMRTALLGRKYAELKGIKMKTIRQGKFIEESQLQCRLFVRAVQSDFYIRASEYKYPTVHYMQK
uniref:Uncharacterized protein n=1 Tax=Romanomermis culicivorax TaxID=13658 RepID=A0A915HHN7_ROMCU